MDPLEVLSNRYGAPVDKVYSIYRALSAYASDQDAAFDMTESVVRALWSTEDKQR